MVLTSGMNVGIVRITSIQCKDAKTCKIIERFKAKLLYLYNSNLDMPRNKRRYPEIIRPMCHKLLQHDLLSFLLVNIEVEDLVSVSEFPVKFLSDHMKKHQKINWKKDSVNHKKLWGFA